MEKEALRNEIVSNIRGCLISVKGKLGFRQLSHDYKQLMGTDIPFRQLGYPNLEDFLRSVPSLSVTIKDGQIFVDAKINQKTSHISSMVAAQKSKKKKKSKSTRRNYVPPPARYYALPPRRNCVPPPTRHYVPPPPRHYVPPPARNYVPPPARKNAPPSAAMYIPPPPPRYEPEHCDRETNKKVELMYNSLFNYNPYKQHAQRPKPPSSTVNKNIPIQKATKPAPSNVKTSNPPPPKQPILQPTKKPTLQPPSNNKPLVMPVEKDSSEFTPSGHAINDLFTYVKHKNLSMPVYKILKRKSKPNGPSFFDCQVKFDDFSASSYPYDFRDEQLAKLCVSKIVLEKLIAKYGLSNKKTVVYAKEEDILQRIPDIVKIHEHGIWSLRVEEDFKNLFNQELPVGWLEIIKNNQNIAIEKFGNRHVLRYCTPEEAKEMEMDSPNLTTITVPSSSILFNEEGFAFAEVLCAVSSREIWCKQINLPESMPSSLSEMEEFYVNKEQTGMSLKVKSVTESEYYVAHIHSDIWRRVRISEVTEDGAHCLLIDFGDYYSIPLDHMYHITPQFAAEPAQAFMVSLAGLEKLYEVSFDCEPIQEMEEMTVVLEAFDENSEPISVVMYNDSTGANINEELIENILKTCACPPLRFTTLDPANISHVEEDGDIYLQLNSSAYLALLNLIEDLETSSIPDIPHLNCDEYAENELYLLKSAKDDSYHRVRVLSISEEDSLVQVKYIDTGKKEVIKSWNCVFYPLEKMCDIVSRFPEQAQLVRLDITEVPVNFAEKLFNLIPASSTILMRSIKEIGDIPLVKVFIRLENSSLVSINDTIVLNNEIEKQATVKRKLEFPSTGILKAPKIPTIGTFFDVKVSIVTNAWDFYVQPYSSIEELAELVKNMKLFYDNKVASDVVVDIKPGNIYAARHEDSWYRVSVVKFSYPNVVNIFFCDFGFYANLHVQNLLPIEQEFLTLPYQAIKSKLGGIKPIDGIFNECLFFKERVSGKNFVSVILAEEVDKVFSNDKVLTLKLIDTTSDVDLYIDDLLIERKIAVAIK